MKIITLTIVTLASLAVSPIALAQTNGFDKNFPAHGSFKKPQQVRGNSVTVAPNPNGGLMGQVQTRRGTTTVGHHNAGRGNTGTSVSHTRNNGSNVSIGVSTNRGGLSSGGVSVSFPTR